MISQTVPVANNDTYTTFVNTSLNVSASGILENDTDADEDVLKVIQFLINGVSYTVHQTAVFDHGTINILEDGSFTFIPLPNYKGDIETITYLVTDGKFTSYAKINISVTVPPSPPRAINDRYTTFVNTTINQAAPGILDNDTDVNEDILKVTQFLINGVPHGVGETSNLAQGSITILEDGSFTFTPSLHFVGNIDTITYTITDGTFERSANLDITVIFPPSPPIASNDSYTAFINEPFLRTAPGILDNDTDINADILKVTEFSINGATLTAGQKATFAQGSLIIFENGRFTYTPLVDFVGDTDTVTYTITDGVFTSSASITISVIIPPTPAIAKDDYNTADENKTLIGPIPGVLVNDTDINEDVLTTTEFQINGTTYTSGQTAKLAEGDFTLFQNGSYKLVPTPNYIGAVPVIKYTITDGTFTSSANLFLTVEPTKNLIEIRSITSCNQGFTSSGNYKISYNATLVNRSNAQDYHAASLVKNIDLANDLQAVFGTGCLVEVSQVRIRNSNTPKDYLGQPYPKEFTNGAVNPNFLDGTSTNFFSDDAVNNLTLYPRQSISISYCVTVSAFCNGRPNPTPSGSSGVDFTNILNITDSSGTATNSLTLNDFHTTEAVVSAGLYVPEFNNTRNSPGIVNSNGTYEYVNTVIITNEGSVDANNVNFNMGLSEFISKGIIFEDIIITQVSGGPSVSINPDFDGITNTNLLTANNVLPAGETIRLEVYYLIGPFNNSSYSYFRQMDISQTQGPLDGFDESSTNNKGRYSFVTWSDALGDHVDRYYYVNSAVANISAESQCSCRTTGMRFYFNSSSSTDEIVSTVHTAPNGILEHEENTFQITIKNTSEAVEIINLQLQDNLNSVCGGNIILVSNPIIKNSTATTDPVLNTNFDGISDVNLFDGNSGLLQANQSITIEFSVLFSEMCKGTNTVVFTASNPLSTIVQSSRTITVSAFTDTDNDGIPNGIDLDDDNDTIPDILEYNGINPLDDDDGDFIPNYRDTDFGADANNDGIVDVFDFDNDGVPNHFDLDSDNDGILDIVEAGNISLDTNRNGTTNGAIGANGLDNSKENNDSLTTTINYIIPNTDANGNANFIDIDADDDGIVDNIEAQLTNNYTTLNATVSLAGINTAYPNGINPVDTENDKIPDYIDMNSDNDVRDDIIEGWDANSDGIPETVPLNSDVDNDGLDDAFDTNDNLVNPSNNQTPLSFSNVDNAETPERDWREIIAIFVQIVTDAKTIEGNNLDFTISLVTKNNKNILVESATPVTIDFTTKNGTEKTAMYDVATASFDYIENLNNTFTIPPFTNTISFSVAILDDPISEIDELFTLVGIITSENTMNNSLETLESIGTILDNELLPSVSISNARANEGDDLVHTLSLSHPSSRNIVVEVFSKENQAVSPDDFLPFREEFTFNGIENSMNTALEISFNIETFQDNLNEFDEEILEVIGILKTPDVASQDVSITGTGTILDIDPNPLVQITSLNSTVEEGEVLSFEIGLFNTDLEPMQNHLPINFTLETIDNTTFMNEDYTFISENINIPAYSFSIKKEVQTINDKLQEGTESFFLQATLTSLDVSNTFFPRGEGFITDNDYPNLFSPNNDGKSDVFEISILKEYPNFILIIFNRQGNEVYNYSNNGNLNPIWWDGTYNNKPVPTGVYFYILDYNDGVKKPIKNFIQLIR
ncbi:cadherin-like domain-containing protein [Polaribacter litorisediminis]|uniref:Ig-like domain-containing protein n=1 Tax=Polaribacter litorisediminis TaxID=1908341 RepID=UPI001CBF4B6D|nr:Ig-like domain-containing protein [Polaribacter litorisediminis]UAM99151.1 cadherin-like domain-containing protein [Polaribacter litorisediminis]